MAARPTRSPGTGTAIYARYSSALQNPRSIADQVADLKRVIERDGRDPGAALVFSDAEQSGSVRERAGLQALKDAIESGRLSAVYVESPDRLSRDVGDLASLRKLLRYHDVTLVCGNGDRLDGPSGASLTYGIKAEVSEHYLRELGDKTRRGLRGNAREGKATGGRLYGYGTSPESTRVEVVEAEARIVREIFALYASGLGYAAIAIELNRRGVAPPRGSRRAGRGWMGSAIREQLRNPRYVGEWRFGVREWRRHPTTRKREPRRNAAQDVETSHRPELAIVDRSTWDTVQARLAIHAEAYKRSGVDRTVPRQRTDYLLSGLLRCGECGALLEISRGSSAGYYRCSANRKRGTCGNRLSVREDTARERILAAVSDALWNPAALAHIRARVAARLGEVTQRLSQELSERRARLARHEDRIRGLVTMQLEGDRSPYVAEMRRDFEAQALQERAAIGELEAIARRPLRLPSPQELAEDRILALDALHEAKGDQVEPARERLRQLLRGGAVLLHPEGAAYVARGELLPLEVLLREPETRAPRGVSAGRCPRSVARAGFEPTTFGL